MSAVVSTNVPENVSVTRSVIVLVAWNRQSQPGDF